VSVIERTLLIYDDDENRLRAYANANRLGDSATALRALLDNADQLAGAVETAYAAGFWAGAQALRDADVILPEDWQRDARAAIGGQS
jgi:hypothetical protein